MLALIGKSGSGKTTIEDILIKEHGYIRAISHTTREKRSSDVDGINYYFVSLAELNALDSCNKLAERVSYQGNVYALSKSQCKKGRVVSVVPAGLVQLLSKADLDIFSIYLDVSHSIREHRMLSRGDSFESAQLRLSTDDIEFVGVECLVNVVLDNNDNNVSDVVSEILTLYNHKKG